MARPDLGEIGRANRRILLSAAAEEFFTIRGPEQLRIRAGIGEGSRCIAAQVPHPDAAIG